MALTREAQRLPTVAKRNLKPWKLSLTTSSFVGKHISFSVCFEQHFFCAGPGTTDPSGCVSTGDKEALKRRENHEVQLLLDDLGQESIKLKPGNFPSSRCG